MEDPLTGEYSNSPSSCISNSSTDTSSKKTDTVNSNTRSTAPIIINYKDGISQKINNSHALASLTVTLTQIVTQK